jgi:predicted RNA-binding Zn-ribbon protein involved in translation (DUF1610 family)
MAAVLIGLVIASSFALAVWFYVRQGRRDEAPARAPARPELAPVEAKPPSVSFPCPGCGKNLRTTGALVGKKVKCPGCGAVVLVPGTRAGKAGHTSA